MTELTAMTLALEEKRRAAEETLTLLAAADAAREDLATRLAAALAQAEALGSVEEQLAAAQLEADRMSAALEDRTEEMTELERRSLPSRSPGSRAPRPAPLPGLPSCRPASARPRKPTPRSEARETDMAAPGGRSRRSAVGAADGRGRSGRRPVRGGRARGASRASQCGAGRLRRRLAPKATVRWRFSTNRSRRCGRSSPRCNPCLTPSRKEDTAAQVQIEALGRQLNTALAQLAAQQSALAESERARAALEAAEAARLAAEAQELERYRSEFFGRLRELLEGREGVRIDGDRFVFSSEVLFDVGSADLAPEGLAQIQNVAALLSEVADDIPESIDWIIRVDGHTDDQQIGAGGEFANNWELSQARAASRSCST
jgi:chemotaxis protein MotB